MRTPCFLAALAFSAVSTVVARASGVARFDSFTEGVAGTVVTDGGLTFMNLDTGLGPVPSPFCIEDASATFNTDPGFTSPNALGFSGYSPGPQAAFARCMAFEITSGLSETSATMDFYVSGGQAGNSIVIERYQGATLASSTTIPLPNTFPFAVLHVSLTGIAFDHLRIVGVGASQMGAFFACVDNVVFSGGASAPGSEFCAGDGLDPNVTTACPCGNFGASGHGCANSVNAAGAELDATGTTNPDTVSLHASGMPVTATAIYLQGDLQDDAVFGDGVRCAGGVLLRMRARVSVGGASSFPDSTDTVLLSVRGGVVPGSGVVRFYQTYYRNAAAAFCPPDTFNVTSGWRITW